MHAQVYSYILEVDSLKCIGLKKSGIILHYFTISLHIISKLSLVRNRIINDELWDRIDKLVFESYNY